MVYTLREETLREGAEEVVMASQARQKRTEMVLVSRGFVRLDSNERGKFPRVRLAFSLVKHGSK